MQAVAGANLVFLDVAAGFRGSIHNARMLWSTALFQKCEGREIVSKPEKVIDGLKIRPILLGDGTYPPTTWLVKPYPNNVHLNNSQKYFNKSLSSARIIVETAFGLLTGSWRCLLKWFVYEIGNIADTVLACFMLRNLTQIKGETYIDYSDVEPCDVGCLFAIRSVIEMIDYTIF